MAFLNPLFIFLITLSMGLSLLFSIPHTSATPSQFSTSILDIAVALHKARQVLSFKPSYQQEEETQPYPISSSFSLPLHPRESLFNSHHKDYRSLVLARLSRDSARVNWILSKLQLVNESEIRPEGLSAPLISGLSQGAGEYFMRIGVGQPVQPFYMIPDTGSNVNWLQCEPCVRCYNQSDPIFDPSRSSSYAEVPCESKQCKELATESCRNHECEYEVMYGDGSTTHGILVTETVTLGNTGSVNRVPMGCGHANQGLFVGAAGIVGLGRGPLSFLYEANATSFSYCLVNRDSNKSSTLDFNSPVPSDSVRTQLVRNPKLDTFYYVGVTGMSVGGRKVPIPPSTFKIQPSGNGGIIVDSGTSITLLEVVAYEAVRNVFVALTQHLKRAKAFDPFDTCYDLSSQKMVTVPTVSFDMSDGQSWRLPVLGYMIPVDDKATFCFAFAPSWFPLSIIGNVQQQGTRVTFDIANSVVGFSPHNCG